MVTIAVPGILSLLLAAEQEPAATQDALAQARSAFEEGRSEEALEHYAALLAERSDWIDAHLGYQDVLVSLDREEEARAHYAELLERGETSWRLLLHGRLLHDAEREEALCRRGLELEPDSFEAHIALYSALRRQGRSEEALAALRRALEIRPDDFDGNMAHISYMSRLRATDECLELYAARRERDPEGLLARMLCAVALLEADRDAEAKQELDACLGRAPDDVRLLNCLLQHHARQRDWESFEETLERLIALEPKNIRALLVGGAIRTAALGDERGVSMIEEACRLEPLFSRCFSSLGSTVVIGGSLSEGGRGERANDLFERALVLDPRNTDAMQGLAMLAQNDGRTEDAIELLERSIECYPHDRNTRRYLGKLYESEGRAEEAREQYERVLAMRPNPNSLTLETRGGAEAELIDERSVDEKLRYLLAWKDLRAGRADAAEVRFEELLAAQPDHVHALWFLARIQQRRGEFERALGLYERHKALVEESDDRVGWSCCAAIRAADCVYRLGRREEAEARYRATLELHGEAVPDHEHLQEIVAAMDGAPADARVRTLEDVRIRECAADDYCVPMCLSAALHQLGIEIDAEVLGPDLRSEGGTSIPDLERWVRARDDLTARTFLASAETIRGIIDRGSTVMVFHELMSSEGPVYHSSLVVGYDDRLGLAFLEDANWMLGFDHMTYAALEGLRAMVLLGADEAPLDVELEGEELCQLMLRVQEAVDEGRVEGLGALLRRALELRGDLARVHRMLGCVHNEEGDRDAGRRSFEAATRCPDATAQDWTLLGMARVEAGEEAAALAAFEVAERLEPAYVVPRARIVQMQMDDPERLTANLQRTAEMVRYAPGNAGARLLRGVLLYRSGELDESRSELELARRLGQDPRTRLYLGYVYERQGRRKEAREVLEECLKITDNPNLQQHVRTLLEGMDSDQ